MDKKALFQMVLCSVLWSIAGVIIKFIDCNAMVVAGFRSLFAVVTIYLFFKITGKKIYINKKIFFAAAIMCISFIAFISANKLTAAANAIVLQYTQPIFIVIISILFLKKRFVRADIIAIFFTFLGIAMFFVDSLESGSLFGNAVAVFAGIMLAALFVLMGEFSASDRMNTIFFGHLFTAAVGIPFVFFTENTFNAKCLILLAVLGVFQIGIPYILFAAAVGKCSALTCSLLGVIEPILNPIWVALFYGEVPGTVAFCGCFVVLLTITFWCVYKNKVSEV